MAPKTLDLNTHAKTFADTYAHARRTGADRPLAHRFGLADVLGEIEEIIAKRVEKAVADGNAAHEAALRTVRAEHAAEIAKLRPPMTVGTITADQITRGLPRYRAERLDGRRVIRDTATGRVADFGTVTTLTTIERWARELSAGTRSATGLVWDSSAYALRARLARQRFSTRSAF